VTLILLGFGSWALYSRNLIIDALTEDFVLTAKAKGVRERDVLYKHAFRSILPPIATMIAMSIPGLVTGAIITETIFSWPGIGQWYIGALNSGNHPVTQAVLYNYAFLVILANLVSDVLYGFLDPRIKVGVRR
jgi:peptide/nickel transport system permease protein